MIYVAWFIAAIAVAQMIEDWYRSHDIDVMEGEVRERRVVSWGTCIAFSGNPAHNCRYFTLLVPFIRSWRTGWGGKAGWHQLVIHKFADEWSYFWLSVDEY